MKTGKNRDLIDQFYTKREISSKCIDLLLNTVNINKIKSLIIEPSAGEGSFSDYFKDKKFNIDTYDIDPKKEYIKNQDFLELDIEKYLNSIGYKAVKKIHCDIIFKK